MNQNTNHHHNNRNLVSQAVSDAVKVANDWKARVPFMLSESPHHQHHSMIDMLSMVNMMPYEKEFFPPDNTNPQINFRETF